MNPYEKALENIKRDIKCRPTGPTGTIASLNSILVDNDGTQTVNPNSLVNLGDVINSTGVDMTFTSPNTVNIIEPGTYYILYDALISNAEGSTEDVGTSLQLNGIITIKDVSIHTIGI